MERNILDELHEHFPRLCHCDKKRITLMVILIDMGQCAEV